MDIVGFRVFVANSAGEFRKIGRVCMAFRAFHPLPFVFSGINREVLHIVLRVLGRRPVGFGAVAQRTIVGEVGVDVVGRLCGVKIGLVTSVAIRWCIAEIAADVAFFTICYFMAFG